MTQSMTFMKYWMIRTVDYHMVPFILDLQSWESWTSTTKARSEAISIFTGSSVNSSEKPSFIPR